MRCVQAKALAAGDGEVMPVPNGVPKTCYFQELSFPRPVISSSPSAFRHQAAASAMHGATAKGVTTTPSKGTVAVQKGRFQGENLVGDAAQEIARWQGKLPVRLTQPEAQKRPVPTDRIERPRRRRRIISPEPDIHMIALHYFNGNHCLPYPPVRVPNGCKFTTLGPKLARRRNRVFDGEKFPLIQDGEIADSLSHLIGADMPSSKLFLSAAVLSLLLGAGAASAADLPARTYTKAPPMTPVYSWTGFYINGGGGYGIWDANQDARIGGTPLTISQKTGGDGYFGTVGAGYDWQVASSWVGGIFADGQFGSIRGTLQDQFNGIAGGIKDRTNWAAGVRVGYLVAPTVLSYVNGGYSGAEFSGTTLLTPGGTPAATTGSFHRDGWFVGGGVENQLGILGFGPGWFMKTEYRAAQYDRVNLTETTALGVLPTTTTFKPLVQTVSTQLVYRFNWSGVAAKY
jgi:outer membrane immunogenic protein